MSANLYHDTQKLTVLNKISLSDLMLSLALIGMHNTISHYSTIVSLEIVLSTIYTGDIQLASLM